MLAPKVASAETKSPDSQAGTLMPQRSMRAAQRLSKGVVEQAQLLQRSFGNQATLRLLSQRGLSAGGKDVGNDHETYRTRATSAPATPQLPGNLQAKLAIGRVDDPLEHEADAVADRVMRMPTGRDELSASPPQISRKCAACEEEDKKLHRRHDGTSASSGEAPDIVHEVVGSGGRPLDASTRAFMEPRFGRDFSNVRIHADSTAGRSADAVNALAYTVDHNVVFAPGQFAPQSNEGRRLLAHELAHVVQQSGAGVQRFAKTGQESASVSPVVDSGFGSAGAQLTSATSPLVQRDLATPLPEDTPEAQADLTDAQIRDAIRYNSQFYDAANTRLIQNILGGPVTGSWTADNIRAIAATQEQYGLKKDGKVGPDTFQFITQEQTAEGAGTDTANCLTSFRVVNFPVVQDATAGPGGTTRIQGHHTVEATFSSRCNCSEFEYRQFIAGVATGSRGGTIQNLSKNFPHIPGGELPIVMREDGNTACPSPNYGHREQVGQTATTKACGMDRYTSDDGTKNQPDGCNYRGEDFPTITVSGLATGDTVDLLVQFRGEIQRNHKTIETRNWTDIDTSVTTP